LVAFKLVSLLMMNDSTHDWKTKRSTRFLMYAITCLVVLIGGGGGGALSLRWKNVRTPLGAPTLLMISSRGGQTTGLPQHDHYHHHHHHHTATFIIIIITTIIIIIKALLLVVVIVDVPSGR